MGGGMDRGATGGGPPPEACFERFRAYLRLLAEQGLDRKLRRVLDPSDLVQETLLEAYRDFERIQGASAEEQAAWLRRILAHNLADQGKAFGRQKRDLDRQRSLEDALERSSLGLERWLAASDPSPSHQAMRQEEVLRLAEALYRIPDGEREAIILRHLSGLTLREIAERTGQTAIQTTRLIQRGLKSLRKALKSDHGLGEGKPRD